MNTWKIIIGCLFVFSKTLVAQNDGGIILDHQASNQIRQISTL